MEHFFSKQNQSGKGSVYRFPGFEVHPAERTLRKNGALVALQPKAFDALLLFLKDAGRLVTKRKLMDELWPSLSVSEANLTNTIVSLRKVLGRDAIRTVSKYGYRFDTPVTGEPNVSSTGFARFSRAKELVALRSLESMTQARELLWTCLAEDPSYAPAWAWLGRCSSFLTKFGKDSVNTLEFADAAIRRAFALDADSPEAHQFYTFLEVDTGHARDAMRRLSTRLKTSPDEPESLASLVQVFRFLGMLDESLAVHRRARELDPAAVTSLAHTLFLAQDYAGTIEHYGGRGAFYLDAAAWAGLGEVQRAKDLLSDRLHSLPLSSLITALLTSLLATLEGESATAVRVMKQADTSMQPEVVMYFARHYAYLNEPDLAIQSIQFALKSGFVCSPDVLRHDPWFASVRSHPDAKDLSEQLDGNIRDSRAVLQKVGAARSGG